MSRNTKIVLGVVAGLAVLSTCAVYCSKGHACRAMRLFSRQS